MSQNNEILQCYVCGDPYVKKSYQLETGLFYVECERCGLYLIGQPLRSLSDDQKGWFPVRHLVSAWIRRENKAGVTPIIGAGADQAEVSSPDWWRNQYKRMGFPEATNEKLNALLLAYADNARGDFQALLSSIKLQLIAETAVKNLSEIQGLTKILEELGFLEIMSETPGGGIRCKISGKGWLYIDELKKETKANDSAFIAMWFHDTTKDYRNAVIAAVEDCGYKAIILDQEEYNGFIMEQVVSQIKQAQFIVADFSCRPESIEENGKVKGGVRGGVYWEAGLAYGLNKPVIHTCKDDEDSKNRRHFDIDQYNTIFWKPDDLNTKIRNLSEKIDNPTFAEKLANRILFVVGKGIYKRQ